MLQIKLHPSQYQIATDNHRFRVVCAGRRWGKSVLSRSILLQWATEKTGLYWIVSPTRIMAKDIHWKQGYNLEIPQSWIEKKNEVDLEIVLKNGSRIALKSAENPDRLRGVGLSGLVVDEIAFLRDWKSIWDEALRPALSDNQAPAIFISTPLGYNHFYELWLKGQKDDKDWKSWKFTTYDNPFISKEEIEQAKQELDEDTFSQEYLSNFKKLTGLVFKEFSREKHVIEPIELQSSWSFYRSIDFGFINPTAVLFLAIDDKGNIIVYDEIYQKGLQTPDLAQLIKEKSLGRSFVNTVADSSQASDIAELQKYGFSIFPISKTSGSSVEDWTTYKIRKTNEKFKLGQIKIFNSCQNLIWELENYKYHEVRQGAEIKERPMKVNDHLIDALTYFICSLPEEIKPTIDDFKYDEIPEIKIFDEQGFY